MIFPMVFKCMVLSALHTFWFCCRFYVAYLYFRFKPWRILLQYSKEYRYIESFNSILESEVIRRFKLETFEEAYTNIRRFVDFYNDEGLRTCIGYVTPRKMNKKCMEERQVFRKLIKQYCLQIWGLIISSELD